MADTAQVTVVETVTQPPPEGANPNGVTDVSKFVPSAAAVAAFKGGPLSPEKQAEMNALEKAINDQLQGRVPVGTPLPPQAVSTPIQPGSSQVAQPPLPQPVPLTVPPVTPQPPVPQKFQNQDGSLNSDRLQQSLVSLQQYLDAEKELTRIRQQDPAGSQQPSVPQNPQQQPFVYNQPGQPQYAAQPMYSQVPPQQVFEERLTRELQVAPVQTLINLHQAAIQTAEANMFQHVQSLQRQVELMQIAQQDPRVFTAQGLAELKQVRVDNPWLDYSPTPWFHAYQLRNGGFRGVPAQVPQAAPQGQLSSQMSAPRPMAPPIPGGFGPTSLPVQTPPVANTADLRQLMDAKFPNNPMAQANFLEEVIKRAAQGAR